MPSVHADSYEKLKTRYRPLFLACQATLREWPGGSSEIWRMLDRHVESTWGQFNPSSYGAGPSLLTFLETLEYTRSRRMAHALGEISGHLTRPEPSASAYAVTREQAADYLGAAMRPILYNLQVYAQHEILMSDRQAMQADLLRLIDAAEVLLRRLSSTSNFPAPLCRSRSSAVRSDQTAQQPACGSLLHATSCG